MGDLGGSDGEWMDRRVSGVGRWRMTWSVEDGSLPYLLRYGQEQEQEQNHVQNWVCYVAQSMS